MAMHTPKPEVAFPKAETDFWYVYVTARDWTRYVGPTTAERMRPEGATIYFVPKGTTKGQPWTPSPRNPPHIL